MITMVLKTKGINKGELQPRSDKTGGRLLLGHIPEPAFCADPNHRCKGLNGDLIVLDSTLVCQREQLCLTS
jgi:hypothetical protein